MTLFQEPGVKGTTTSVSGVPVPDGSLIGVTFTKRSVPAGTHISTCKKSIADTS